MILENLEKNGIFLDTFIYPDPQIPSGLIDAVEYVWQTSETDFYLETMLFGFSISTIQIVQGLYVSQRRWRHSLFNAKKIHNTW